MSKQKFIEVVESLFQIHPVDAGAVEYFNKTVKSKKLNQKEIEKARVVKEAILKYLTINAGKMFDRTEIANALYNAGDFKEEYLINDKGTIAYNSITAFANQLVTSGSVKKQEIKEGKIKKVKYSI